MKRARKIISHLLFHDGKLIPGGMVSLTEDGTVLEVGRTDEPDREAGAEFYGGILIPGMVNSHCHLELSYMKGTIEPGGGYTAFARAMSEKRGEFTPEGRRAALQAADATMWHQGVSAVGDICNGNTTFDIKSRSGICYHNFLEFFGLHEDMDIETHFLDTARQASAARLRFSTTPHSLYSLSDDAFRQAVAGFSHRTIPGEYPLLSVHFMESPEEAELFRHQGNMWEWYLRRGITPAFTAEYSSPARRLTALTPPGRDVMLIHDCCITEEDYDRITGHFTGRVTWVLCPRSNRYITGLQPPVALLRRKGARIAVGTDSLASNDTLNLIEELKCFTGTPLEEMFGWATSSGAQALGIDSECGSFRPGTRPGGTLVTGIDWSTMTLSSEAASVRVF